MEFLNLDLLKENLFYIKRDYLGLVYVGVDKEDDILYLWTDNYSQMTLNPLKKSDIPSIISYLKKYNIVVTEDWEEFTYFMDIVNEGDSGLIARELSHIDIPFLSLVQIVKETPRYYFKNMKEASNNDDFFYNFADEKQFYGSSQKTKLKYIRRWLRNKKFIKVIVNDEQVYLMVKRGDNGTIVPNNVINFFKKAV